MKQVKRLKDAKAHAHSHEFKKIVRKKLKYVSTIPNWIFLNFYFESRFYSREAHFYSSEAHSVSK